jgi:sporulation protein YlmC with PRC-barrel domain
MNRYSVFTVAFATALTLPMFVASAQVPKTTQRSDINAGALDSKTSGANVRASQLMGLNIKNSQGASVGEINDLVVDSNTGQIRYVAVTYGGLFGLGDKLFAVPFEAFRVTHNPNDPNDRDDLVMVLDVTKQQLEGAQGFDQDHWPNMADQDMLHDLDRRYGIDRAKIRERNGRAHVDVNVTPRGVDVDVERK